MVVLTNKSNGDRIRKKAGAGRTVRSEANGSDQLVVAACLEVPSPQEPLLWDGEGAFWSVGF